MLLLDVADLETQRHAGRQLWRRAPCHGAFAVGSSGVEYALILAWREAGLIAEEPTFQPADAVERLAVVSGSVSPTTENQIRAACQAGFEAIALDPVALSLPDSEATVGEAVREGMMVLQAGRSVILHTALGPQSNRGAEIDQTPDARHKLGRALGDILKRLVLEAGLRRAVIAGGDTSSHALGRLGVDALTTRMPLPQTPGSPLCTAHSDLKEIDGLEVAMKGGQIGGDDYFNMMRNGM
jgi:uncharacterized protein YgbK (DUF1537 family)